MFITAFIQAYAKPEDATPHLHSIYPAKFLLLPVGLSNKILCTFSPTFIVFFFCRSSGSLQVKDLFVI